MSIIIVGLFDLLPAVTTLNQPTQLAIFKIVLHYALFAFIINLLREMVKDIEDIDGDYKAEMKTLPIIMGRERAGILVFLFSLLPLFGVVYYLVIYLYKQPLAVGYFLLFVIAPLLYFTIKSYSAETKPELKHLSNILKLIMLFGVLSLLLYPFMLK